MKSHRIIDAWVSHINVWLLEHSIYILVIIETFQKQLNTRNVHDRRSYNGSQEVGLDTFNTNIEKY